MHNGFQHDLKAVCDLAHAHGAYVYADIIQGVGASPLDVRATGLDFAASATYKWLMGDFGLGFLFVREDLLGTVVRRHEESNVTGLRRGAVEWVTACASLLIGIASLATAQGVAAPEARRKALGVVRERAAIQHAGRDRNDCRSLVTFWAR